jgi:hypothetical protein
VIICTGIGCWSSSRTYTPQKKNAQDRAAKLCASPPQSGASTSSNKAQYKCGTGESGAHGRTSEGNREQTRMVPSTAATNAPSGDKLVRIVTLTTPSLPLVDTLLTESQRWSLYLYNRSIFRSLRQSFDTFYLQGQAPNTLGH